MADHIRKQIRDKLVGDLTGLALTGSNVFAGRRHKVTKTELPALLIYITGEGNEIDSLSRPRGLTREIDVSIEAVAEDNTALDDTLDQICHEVEDVLGNTVLGGLAKDVRLIGGEDIPYDAKSDKKIGAWTMNWVVEVRTPENDPTTTT